jgi:hypothetical protein
MRTMRACRSRVEHDPDLRPDRQSAQPIHALMRGRQAQVGSPRQPIGRRVDTHQRAHFQSLAVAHDLDHQVRADIAGANNRRLNLGVRHTSSAVANHCPSPKVCHIVIQNGKGVDDE